MIPWRNLRRLFYKTLRQPVYAFRVFSRRLRASFYYSWGDGRSSHPEAITLFLTHRCNLRCKMCGQWGEGGITKKQGTQYIQEELSWEELFSFIDDVSTFKPNITLFGGEPLLYPHCLLLIKHIKEKGMHCLVITNGSLLENMAEEIVDSGLNELNVSLDGNAQLHDQIRAMPGLFDKIMKGLKQISYFKNRKNKKKPLINIQCTITRYNYEHLGQLIDVAKEAKVSSLTFHNLIFIGEELIAKQKEYDRLLGCTSSDWEGFQFEPDINPELLYNKIREIISIKAGFNIDFYPKFSHKELFQYYQNPQYRPSEYGCRCLSPWIVAYVFPEGEVRPCLNFSYSFGNIKQNKFQEIWNSQQAVNYRRILRQNRIFPICVRCTELYRY